MGGTMRPAVLLRELHVENFRAIRRASLRLDASTTLVGENDCGKGSLIRVLALVLGDRADRRLTTGGRGDGADGKEGRRAIAGPSSGPPPGRRFASFTLFGHVLTDLRHPCRAAAPGRSP
jgi:hypothetical protein